MDRDTKSINAEVGHWLRVGFLTLTTFGPIINSIAAQLRQRAEVAREEALKQSSTATAEGQARLQAVGASLGDALVELKEHPYSQEIIRRGSDLGGTLTEQSSKLSRVLTEQGETLLERGSKATQVLAERSSEVVSDLAERSSQVSKDVAKRSEQLSKEVAKRSKKVSKEVAKRSEKLAKEVSERSQMAAQSVSQRNGTFWSVVGFSLGLSAALVGIYWLIRRRTQDESLESQSFQIAQNGHLNGAVKQPVAAGASVSQPSAKAPQPAQAAQSSASIVAPSAPTPTPEPVRESAPESAVPSPTLQQAPVIAQAVTTEKEAPEEVQAEAAATPAPLQAEKPLDAAFLGLASNKRYYPIETPLDQLPRTEGEPLDVIYFASEQEAQAQGFSAAE